MELVKPSIDYESIVNDFIHTMPSVYAVAIIEANNEIVFSTDNWDISADIDNICTSWNAQNAPFINVSGVKYTMLECEIDSMVATSIRGEGHIVGCKDEERKIITYIEPNGDRKAAIIEISRILVKMSSKTPYIETSYTDPKIRAEIEDFLNWINHPNGLKSYIEYYIQQEDSRTISKLAKIYEELMLIINS